MLTLSAPWITFVHYIENLFSGDSEVETSYSEDTYTLKIFVNNEEKYEALRKLIPSTKEFGNITLHIDIVPADEKDGKVNYADLYKKAFKGNPHVDDIKVVRDYVGGDITFVVFKKEVVQFFNDNICDLHGLMSTLDEDMAREVFISVANVNFCTDNK